EERTVVTEAAQRMIDMAAELGAPLLRVFGGPLPQGTTRSSLLAPTAEVLHTICTYAAERDITIALETHDSWSTSADVLALFQAAASPAARVLWDIHHTFPRVRLPLRALLCWDQLLLMSTSKMVALVAARRDHGNSACSMKVRYRCATRVPRSGTAATTDIFPWNGKSN